MAMAGNFSTQARAFARPDFNVWFDPHSAKVTLECGVKVTLLPRNACSVCTLDEPTIRHMAAINNVWGLHLFKDMVGMLAQHGPSFPLVDVIVPLLLVHPQAIKASRRGFVYVRRTPLGSSGQTYFQERGDGHVLLIDELDVGLIRHALIQWGRSTRHLAASPESSPRTDFPTRTWFKHD